MRKKEGCVRRNRDLITKDLRFDSRGDGKPGEGTKRGSQDLSYIFK